MPPPPPPEIGTVAMTTPPVRMPRPCGEADRLFAGREPTQLGWYSFIIAHLREDMDLAIASGSTILDVGAGSCAGLQLLLDANLDATGLETDGRLSILHERLRIGRIEDIDDDAFDVVFALDVIEHVVEDLVFMAHLRRIARWRVFVSTPNRLVSECENPHHCREYTIDEFNGFFRPDEMWVATPDGWRHRTKLDPKGENLDTLRAPNGHPWAHFLGVFDIRNTMGD